MLFVAGLGWRRDIDQCATCWGSFEAAGVGTQKVNVLEIATAAAAAVVDIAIVVDAAATRKQSDLEGAGSQYDVFALV